MPAKSRGVNPKFRKKRKYYHRRFRKHVSFPTKVINAMSKYAERKYFDTNVGISVSNTGSITELSQVPVGTTDSSRNGDRITARMLQLRGHVLGADSTNVVRILICQWMTNTAPVNVNQLLQVAATDSPYIHDTGWAFRVLYDKTFTTTVNGDNCKCFRARIFPFRKNLKFDGGGTTGKCKFYLATISDSGAVTHPTVEVYSRLSYLDF